MVLNYPIFLVTIQGETTIERVVKLMTHARVISQLRRRVHTNEYRKIRRLWQKHSIAEDRRNIPGLLATLTEDCVYTVVNTGVTWHGHTGAEAFYTELLFAFPDVHFNLQNIVIGPQGVFEEAHVTGTHTHAWQGLVPTGQRIEFEVLIFFPWDPERKLFAGERVFYINPKYA